MPCWRLRRNEPRDAGLCTFVAASAGRSRCGQPQRRAPPATGRARAAGSRRRGMPGWTAACSRTSAPGSALRRRSTSCRCERLATAARTPASSSPASRVSVDPGSRGLHAAWSRTEGSSSVASHPSNTTGQFSLRATAARSHMPSIADSSAKCHAGHAGFAITSRAWIAPLHDAPRASPGTSCGGHSPNLTRALRASMSPLRRVCTITARGAAGVGSERPAHPTVPATASLTFGEVSSAASLASHAGRFWSDTAAVRSSTLRPDFDSSAAMLWHRPRADRDRIRSRNTRVVTPAASAVCFNVSCGTHRATRTAVDAAAFLEIRTDLTLANGAYRRWCPSRVRILWRWPRMYHIASGAGFGPLNHLTTTAAATEGPAPALSRSGHRFGRRFGPSR